MSVSSVIQDFGTGTMYVGGGALFVMAVVGTLSIDIVMMAAVQKQAKEGKYVDLLFTMYVWHLLSGNNGQPMNPLILLAISPITSAIAIVLSVAYEVPMVGACIAGGWGIAASILLLGWAINKLGKWLESSPKDENGYSYSAKASNNGLFAATNPPVAHAYPVYDSVANVYLFNDSKSSPTYVAPSAPPKF